MPLNRLEPPLILNYERFQCGTSVVVLYVVCFCVGFVLFSHSLCLDDIKLGLGTCSCEATFWERAAHSNNRLLP